MKRWLLLLIVVLYRYATIFTNFPVFSLVLDKDVSSEIAMTYPELYKDLTKVRGTVGMKLGVSRLYFTRCCISIK